MRYQDKLKEKPQLHYAHDGGRFDKVFERKVEERCRQKVRIRNEYAD